VSISVRILRINWRWIANIEKVEWPQAGSVPDNGDGVSFIQMHNGVGKTTTLYLLRCIFTHVPPDVTGYARTRYKGPLSRGDEPSEISVDLCIDGHNYILGLQLWPEDQRCEFYTVAPRSGREAGWHPPTAFKNKFEANTAFAELFLFDTQKAGAMTESLPAALVDRAILEVANLRLLSHLKDKGLDDLYARRIQALQVVNGERVLERTRNAIARLETIKKEREDQLEELVKKISTVEANLSRARTARKALENESVLREQLETANSKIDSSLKNVSHLTKELVKAYLEPSNLPAPFWATVVDYFSRMDSLRIPEVIAREIVDEILEKGRCICGQDLNEKNIACLENYRDRMTGADVVQEIFHIKDSVRDASCGSGDVDDLVKRLCNAKNNLDEHRNNYRRILEQLDVNVQESLDRLDQELEELQAELNVLNGDRHAITCIDSVEIQGNHYFSGRAFTAQGTLSVNASDYANCLNISTIKRILDVLREKEASASGAARMRSAYSLAGKILSNAFDRTLSLLKDALRDEANIFLPRLQTTGMRINSFESGMTLVDRQGQVQRGANTGGELSAQYSFLMALRQLGEVDIPMVIDNPTKGLDGTAVRSFQKEMPAMFKQCVMFIYPMEKPALAELIAGSNCVSTLHRSDEEVSGIANGGGDATGPIVATDDRTWFVAYDPPSLEHI